MATTLIRRQRTASPERWAKAAERAIANGIEVRQLAGSGAWIATSGSDGSAAYELQVTGSVAHGCDCLAGLNNDPICQHRAAWYLAAGLLSIEPEPTPPAAPSGPMVYAGQGRVVVVSQRDRDGLYEILDPAKRQRLGAAGELAILLDRLASGGYVREEAMALAA